MDKQPKNRIDTLDEHTVSGLISDTLGEVIDAIGELPDALTVDEVRSLAAQVGMSTDTRMYDVFRQERKAVFQVGLGALLLKEDMITAQNAAKRVATYGLAGAVASLRLRWEIHKRKKDIIDEIVHGASPNQPEE